MLEIKKKSINKKQEIIIIFLIGIVGLLTRFYFFPYDTPISGDAIDYFSYSIALARGEIFPDGYIINKFGWSIFLSPFFAIFNNPEMIDLMNVQRIVSITISVLTIIPLYFLIKNFFNKEIGIVCSSLFIFSPKIIENSLLGISDPLFIFLMTTIIMLVFVKNTKYYFLSYIVAGFAFVVRQEGILIIIPLIIFFIVKKEFRKEKIGKITIGIVLFFVIVLTSDFVLTEDMDNISIFDTVFYATQISEQEIIINLDTGNEKTSTITNNISEFIKNAIFNYSQFLIWILLPNAIFFILFSIFTIQKKISKNRIIILIFFIFLSLTGLFTYGKGIQEVRYLFILIPLLALFSGYGINKIQLKMGNNVLFLIIPIVILSMVFSFFSNDDMFAQESFSDSKILVESAKGINNFDGHRFVKVAVMYHNWPELLPYGENRKIFYGIEKFQTGEYQTLKDFIFSNYDKGLTHLVIYEKNNSEFLDEVFFEENKFPYLHKIYDSELSSNVNKVKIFEINHVLIEKLL